MVYKKSRKNRDTFYYNKKGSEKFISGNPETNYKKFFMVFLCFVFIVFLFYLFTQINTNIHGRAILFIDDADKSESVVRLSLKQGEFIPASSKIILENEDEKYEYLISDFVSDEPTEGNYYIEGTDLSGSGLGYGVAGVKKIYPEISFVLKIYEFIDENNQEEIETTEENVSENNSTEVLEENSTSESEIIEETQTGTNQVITEETEIQNGEISDEGNLLKETTESSDADLSTEVSPEKVTEAITETSEPEQEEIPVKIESSEETTSVITGNIVSNFLGGVYNFFLGLNPTGRIIEEPEREISGKASSNNEFVYQIEEGQNVRLIAGSVNVDGNELPDDSVNVNIVNNQIIVTTDYSEEETGFGENYLGNVEKEISINISSLNPDINIKDFKIKLVNEDEEILFLDSLSDKIKEKNVSEAEVVNETEIGFSDVLTDEEIIILTKNFGNNFSVKTTKAEVFNGRIIVRNVLGDYWIENSYDYNGNIDDNFNVKIERDKIKFLKDLAGTLSEDKKSPEDILDLIS